MEIISGSQSKRINFPRRPSFFKNSEACPPPSAVASITNESRRMRSPRTLSSSRTGRWAISVGSDLSQFFGELVGRSFNLALVFFPAGTFPDFNSFLHSYDYGLFLKPGVFFQKVRNQDASQAVEFHFRSARKKKNREAPELPVPRGKLGDFVRDFFPLFQRVKRQAFVGAAREDRLFTKLAPKFCRNGQALLGVQIMYVFAYEHKKMGLIFNVNLWLCTLSTGLSTIHHFIHILAHKYTYNNLSVNFLWKIQTPAVRERRGRTNINIFLFLIPWALK